MSFGEQVASSHEWGHAALASIVTYGLAATPECYMVWYSYHADRIPELRRQLNELKDSGDGVTADAVEALYERFFTTRDELRAIEEAGVRIDRALAELVDEVKLAGRETNSYGGTLNDLDARLQQEEATTERVVAIVSELRHETRKMGQRTTSLETRLNSSAEELDVLKKEVVNARREANTDALTGLANRRSFDWELSRCTEAAAREHGPLSLLMIDIDFFKSFNDRFGHQVGDIILKFVAKRLTETVGNAHFIARYGGEEFTVILTDEWLDQATSLADTIRAAICANRIHLRRRDLDVGTITISVGAAEYRHGEDPAEMVHRADRALFAAKRGGRNRVFSELDLPNDLCLGEPEVSSTERATEGMPT